MIRKHKFILFLLVGIVLTSCKEENRILDKNVILEDREWGQNNVLSYDVLIEDSSLTYDLSLNIRNSLDYPYSNMFFLYSISDENENLILANQKELVLFDKMGKPLGSGESFLGIHYGDLYYSSNSFEKFKFPHQGSYTIKVVQNMRNEPILDGVMAVGIKVEK